MAESDLHRWCHKHTKFHPVGAFEVRGRPQLLRVNAPLSVLVPSHAPLILARAQAFAGCAQGLNKTCITALLDLKERRRLKRVAAAEAAAERGMTASAAAAGEAAASARLQGSLQSATEQALGAYSLAGMRGAAPLSRAAGMMLSPPPPPAASAGASAAVAGPQAPVRSSPPSPQAIRASCAGFAPAACGGAPAGRAEQQHPRGMAASLAAVLASAAALQQAAMQCARDALSTGELSQLNAWAATAAASHGLLHAPPQWPMPGGSVATAEGAAAQPAAGLVSSVIAAAAVRAAAAGGGAARGGGQPPAWHELTTRTAATRPAPQRFAAADVTAAMGIAAERRQVRPELSSLAAGTAKRSRATAMAGAADDDAAGGPWLSLHPPTAAAGTDQRWAVRAVARARSSPVGGGSK